MKKNSPHPPHSRFLSCYWRVRWSEVCSSQFPWWGALINGTQNSGGACQANSPSFSPSVGYSQARVFLSSLPEKVQPAEWTHRPNQPCVSAPAPCEVRQWGDPLCLNALHLSLLPFPAFLTCISWVNHQHFNTCFRLCFPEGLLINLAESKFWAIALSLFDIEMLHIFTPFRNSEMSVTSTVTAFQEVQVIFTWHGNSFWSLGVFHDLFVQVTLPWLDSLQQIGTVMLMCASRRIAENKVDILRKVLS